MRSKPCKDQTNEKLDCIEIKEKKVTIQHKINKTKPQKGTDFVLYFDFDFKKML